MRMHFMNAYRMKTKMNQAPSRLSLRTVAATLSGTMNTLLRAGLAGALLALTAACSGNMDAGSEGIDGVSEEAATFDDNATINKFNVGCTPTQKMLIRAAEARALEILAIAGPANANARVNRTTGKGTVFQIYFVPNGNPNPDPKRTSPDAWDTASFRVGQKQAHLFEVLASPGGILHTCHGGNETLFSDNGVFKTCNQLGVNAATNSVAADGLAANTVRWCEGALGGNPDTTAVTLLHELTHQNRTNDATGHHVADVTSPDGPLYIAQNWSSWFGNNLQ